jgi:hypothetical protein
MVALLIELMFASLGRRVDHLGLGDAAPGKASNEGSRRREDVRAVEVGEREEPQAVRGPQGQGHVQGARGQDRQQPRRLQQGGKSSGKGGNATQGGTTAQKKAAGRKGGKAAAKKS